MQGVLLHTLKVPLGDNDHVQMNISFKVNKSKKKKRVPLTLNIYITKTLFEYLVKLFSSKELRCMKILEARISVVERLLGI